MIFLIFVIFFVAILLAFMLKKFPDHSEKNIDSIEYAKSEYAKSLLIPRKPDEVSSTAEVTTDDYYPFDKFGYDQYSAYRFATRNKLIIKSSQICGCFFCYEIYTSDEVTNWMDNDETAICPKCGLGNVVIGSSSGLPIDKDYLSLVGAHWF
jgi:hypothetical protein